MTRCFWGNHNHIQISTRLNLAIMHIKAVCKCKGSTLLDIGVYFFVVNISNLLIWQQHHYDIGVFNSFSNFFNSQTSISRFIPRRTVFTQTHRHVHTGVF